MKTALKLLGIPLLAFLLWAWLSYPKVGTLAFKTGAALESRVYGLTKKSIDIGELEMVLYEGGPSHATSDAETIVMVHGYTADKEVWPRFARHLINDYHIVIPDLAGHGETAFNPQGDYSIGAQAARIAALMDELRIDKAHIIGNSMGGCITAYFAIHYPQRSLSAAPIDPGCVDSPTLSDMRKMLAEGKNPFLIKTREDFRNFYPMTMAQPPWLPGFVLDAMAEEYLERRQRYTQIFADIHPERLEAKLPLLKVPALLIWGDQDRLIHVSAAQVWAAGVPQLQVEIMQGIGHMPMVERPTETAYIYRNFLSSIH